MSPRVTVLVVFAIVLLSRLPFVGEGYGLDPDAWRYAEAAREMVRTESYRESRLPGYPVPELTYATLAYLLEGPGAGEPTAAGTGSLGRAFSVCVAILSAVAAAAFARALGRLGTPDAWLGGLALAFTPVIYVQSVGAMDYVWSLAFLMLAFERALARRLTVAGIWLGLAIGTRLTMSTMLLPMAILAAAPRIEPEGPPGEVPPAPSFARIMKLVAPAVLVGGAAFLPPLLTHGPEFLAFVDQSKPIPEILKRLTLGVFGTLGVPALILTLLLARAMPDRVRVFEHLPREHVVAWAIAWMLIIAVFLRLPIEAGFLIPAVPFTLLLAGRALPRVLFVALCAALLVAPFASVVRSGPRPGPVLWESRQRAERRAIVEELLESGQRLGPDAVIVAGYLMPEIRVTMTERGYSPEASATFIYLPERHEMQAFLARGTSVYVVPGMESFHALFHEYDLFDAGAQPLLLTSVQSET